MPTPQTKQELQSLLGTVNYLQTFVPHLSHHTEPLRVLLKKENTFTWDQNVNRSFQKIKGLLENTLLKPFKYYNRNKPVTLQCLTDTETRYANIERELLEIVFGCEKFHTYLYGRSFTVETDHKPLEMISLKNLISAPVCLQRMLLCLQQYNMVIKYQPGREMLLANTRSHLPSWANNTEIKLDLQVNAISISAFSSSWLTKTANETQKDWILSTVHQLTLNGWPKIWRHIPRIACNYWDFRDELSIKGDLLMKGERIVILTMCRYSILADLHKSHEGANRSLSLARTCLYWPRMEADIVDYIKQCVMFIDNSKMPVETLHPHEVPTRPWVKLGMDFFQNDSGNKFLIIVDYLSKFPFIFPVAMTHHNKMLRYLRDLFSTESVLAVVMTNNRPPFNGEEFKHFAREFDFTHVLTPLPSIEWIHLGDGEEGESCLQKDRWISKCSSLSTATATGHTTSVRLVIWSRDFAWMAHTRSCHAPSSQTHQHPENMPMTTRNTEHSKGTFWSSSQSQGWKNPQSERTSMVLSK